MKRIISVILCFACICMLLTACTEDKPDPAKVINSALERTAALNSINAEVEMNIDLMSNGVTVTIPMTMTCKGVDLQSESPRAAAVMEMSAMGVSIEMEMYMEDEWIYVNAFGSGLKINADAYEAANGSINTGADYLETLPEEILKDVELIANSDGSQTATVSVPNDVFTTLFEDLIDSANSTASTDAESVTVNNAMIVMTIKDGYIVTYDISFEMVIENSGESITAKVSAKTKYNDPGMDVTITPPEGYQSFVEVPVDSLVGA